MRSTHRPFRFPLDRVVMTLLLLGALVIAVRAWLADHPQHDPWAPLDLRDPSGWATQRKLAELRDDPQTCHAVLTRSGIAFRALPPIGDSTCRADDRTVLRGAPLSPTPPPTTCAVAAGFELWLDKGVQPAARTLLNSEVARIEHLGAYNCRKIAGRGVWSEHATGNAIDIAAFVLANGRRISVLRDWPGDTPEARFLRLARDEACKSFRTVLSPAYNSAHADHLHLDQAKRRFGGVCR